VLLVIDLIGAFQLAPAERKWCGRIAPGVKVTGMPRGEILLSFRA
jgi:hypothetical protein